MPESGNVHFQQGLTLKLGPQSYEFVRIDVGITLPVSSLEDAEEQIPEAVAFVEKHLGDQVKQATGQDITPANKKAKTRKKIRRKP